jgi:hypothetical protein
MMLMMMMIIIIIIIPVNLKLYVNNLIKGATILAHIRADNCNM